jgi:hypothetical protein
MSIENSCSGLFHRQDGYYTYFISFRRYADLKQDVTGQSSILTELRRRSLGIGRYKYNCQRVTVLSEHHNLNQGPVSLYFNWTTIYRVSHRFSERKKIRGKVCQYKNADSWNVRSALGHVSWDTQQVHTVSVKCILRNKECSYTILLRSIRHGGEKKSFKKFYKKKKR